MDEDDEIVRFRLDADQVHIGRDRGNDIWLEHPNVPRHALVIYKRDGRDNIKVYSGAKVLLNGVVITGMHRLYSGDRIGVVDRDFFYGEDSARPDIALGVTVFDGDDPLHSVVLCRARVLLGRRGCDINLRDPSVSDRHLILECYSSDALFVSDLGEGMGTALNGQPMERRRRISDGAVLQVGRVQVKVKVLPVDAFGLLLPVGRRARKVEEIRPWGQRAEPLLPSQRPQSAPSPERRPRPEDQAQRVEPREQTPAATVIGSLAELREGGSRVPVMEPRVESMPAPATGRRSFSQPPPPSADAPSPSPWRSRTSPPGGRRPLRETGQQRQRPETPSVRLRADVIERARVSSRSEGPPPLPSSQGSSSRAGPPRIASRAQEPRRQVSARPARSAGREPPRRRTASKKRSGFHEQHTDVLASHDVQEQVREHFRTTGEQVPVWMETEEPHYRPSQEPSRSSAKKREAARGAGRSHPRSSSRQQDERASMRAWEPSRVERPVDPAQLTNVLDVVPDRPRLAPQSGSEEGGAADLGSSRYRPSDEALEGGYSHHDPHALLEGLVHDRRDPGAVDDARRRRSQIAVDDSPRYYDDEE